MITEILEEEWRGRPATLKPGNLAWLPYPMWKFTYLLTHVFRFGESGTFLDLGAGIGTKVMVAADFGLKACGIEIVPEYLAEASRLGANVREGDVRTAQVAGFGIVYINHPLADEEEEMALERRVQAELSPGSVLISVNSAVEPGTGAHWEMMARLGDRDTAVRKMIM